MFLLAEEDGWEVGKDCSSSSACKSEQRCIRGALCGKISEHLSALCLGMTKLFLSVQSEFLARQPCCACECKTWSCRTKPTFAICANAQSVHKGVHKWVTFEVLLISVKWPVMRIYWPGFLIANTRQAPLTIPKVIPVYSWAVLTLTGMLVIWED